MRRFSAVSTSSALNGSSISSRSGSTTSARAKPTRWRMPAGELLRERRLEAVEPDQVDRLRARAARRSSVSIPCASRPSSTFCCTVSHGSSANVWNTSETPGLMPSQRSTAVADGAARRAAPARRCSAAASTCPSPTCPSSATISPALHVEGDPLEHRQLAAVARRERLRHVADRDQRPPPGGARLGLAGVDIPGIIHAHSCSALALTASTASRPAGTAAATAGG